MAVPSNIDQLKEWFASYSLSQKMAIVGSGALSLVFLWTLVYFVNQVDYQVLYSGLDPADTQGVVESLQGMSIDYQVSDDGTTVRVSEAQISAARIQLASDGFPSSGRIGFEIFDRTSFGLTNFQEQVNFQRALEGELARSIATLTEVDVARVHLVLPRESLFQSAEDQTKASIILRLSRGNSLGEAAVEGIVHLVASSVKGLEASNVTVIDYSGRMLSRNDEGGPASGRQLDTRAGAEMDLANKITQILEPVVGVGKVGPQVSLVMDWQEVEETIEQYDPTASVIRSQQRRTERGPGNQDRAIGIPGPQGEALDPLVELLPAQESGGFLTEDEVVNFEVSKSVRHVVNPTGEIERMSVAVIIDDRVETTVDEEGVATSVLVSWTPQDMTKYRDLVAATVGFTPERGDTLIVENVSFGKELLPLLEPPTLLERGAPAILMGLRYLIISIVFLFAYLLFLRPLQKTIFAKWQPQFRPQLTAGEFAAPGQIGASPVTMDGIQAPVTVGQLEQQLTAQPLPALPGQQSGTVSAAKPVEAEEADDPQLLPLPSSKKVDMIRSRIIEHAKREPETIARLVRMWLNESN